ALAEDGGPLRVAPLAHVHLEVRRELPRVDDGVVLLARDVDEVAGPLLADVDRARPVAPLAVDAEGDAVEPVLRARDEPRHRVVARHARLGDGAAEPAARALEPRREPPPPHLRVPLDGDLV